MQTSTPERIARYRELGWWGDDTVHALMRTAVDAAPARTALADPPNRAELLGGEPRRYTWAELDAVVAAMQEVLREAGIARGDCVLMQLPNTVESVVVYLALAGIGAIASPVPVQYGTHELAGIDVVLQPVAYLAPARFRGEPFLDARAAAFRPAVRRIAIALPDGAPRARSDCDAAISADDVFTVCWTSGTTGTPKGVPRSHNHWLAQTVAMLDIGIEPGMRMLCPFPLVNMASLAGFFFPWLLQRGTLVLHHPFDLGLFLRQIEAESIAYTVAPPAVLNMLLQQPELMSRFDLSSLRLVASGSAPLAPSMVSRFQREHGVEVVNIFGSNEGMALVCSAQDVPDPVQRATLFPRFGAAGFAWSNRIAARMRTRLVDPDGGAPIEQPGVPGEMQISGPNVVDGYLAAPEANAACFSADGWFRSGDLFEIAAEDARFYRFLGRCKDIIVRGGMKISPDEIDALLAGHPAIAEAAVAAYPDAVLGERIAVVAVPRPDAELTLAAVIAHLEAAGLARFKFPERLVIAARLPRNPLGKVQRDALRALLPTDQLHEVTR